MTRRDASRVSFLMSVLRPPVVASNGNAPLADSVS
jgi:hypothetical protein